MTIEVGREVRGGDRVLSIRVPAAVAIALTERATREERTLGSLVRVFIRQGLEADPGRRER